MGENALVLVGVALPSKGSGRTNNLFYSMCWKRFRRTGTMIPAEPPQVFSFNRNPRSPSIRISVHLPPESVFTLLRNMQWTTEQAFDELKVHLAERAVVLRSKPPELVEQEFYALLLAHAAVRRLMTQAAAASGQVAEDLSFIHAVRILRRRLPSSGAIPP